MLTSSHHKKTLAKIADRTPNHRKRAAAAQAAASPEATDPIALVTRGLRARVNLLAPDLDTPIAYYNDPVPEYESPHPYFELDIRQANREQFTAIQKACHRLFSHVGTPNGQHGPIGILRIYGDAESLAESLGPTPTAPTPSAGYMR